MVVRKRQEAKYSTFLISCRLAKGLHSVLPELIQSHFDQSAFNCDPALRPGYQGKQPDHQGEVQGYHGEVPGLQKEERFAQQGEALAYQGETANHVVESANRSTSL